MRALDSQTLSTTATCFQCHGYGRRTGLKIRSVFIVGDVERLLNRNHF